MRPRRFRTVKAALVLGLLLGATGCEDIQKSAERLAELAPSSDFGTATRERLASDEDGTTFRMMIVANSPASWLDADFALFKDLAYLCRDGEAYEVIAETPEGTSGGFEALERKHTAGTTFTRVIRCAPTPPWEFALEEGTEQSKAFALVRERLAGGKAVNLQRHIVQASPFNDRDRKYPAITRTLGEMMQRRMQQCPMGFTIERIVVGAHPRPEEQGKRSLHGSYTMVGVDAPCRQAPLAPGKD